MSDGRKKQQVDLAAKKRSLLHTYDSFLIAQARIFTLANYVYAHIGTDVENQQEQLFFDDLLNFGIAARRLIELSGTKSFANHVSIPESFLDLGEAPITIALKGTKIGFLAFVNCIIHAKYVKLFRTSFDFFPYQRRTQTDKDTIAMYSLFEKVNRENRWREYAINVSVLVVTDTDMSTMITLSDLTEASEKVMERIVDKCSNAGIYLEMDYRRVD